jgi:hypothetical protein
VLLAAPALEEEVEEDEDEEEVEEEEEDEEAVEGEFEVVAKERRLLTVLRAAALEEAAEPLPERFTLSKTI